MALGFADVIFVTIYTWNRIYVYGRSVCVIGEFRGFSELSNGLWCGLYDWYF